MLSSVSQQSMNHEVIHSCCGMNKGSCCTLITAKAGQADCSGLEPLVSLQLPQILSLIKFLTVQAALDPFEAPVSSKITGYRCLLQAPFKLAMEQLLFC